MKRKQHDISVKLRVLMPCSTPISRQDAAIQRENERYEKAPHPVRKTREPRNDEATRLLLQYSQQQAQVEGQIAAARQSAGIATERMTEAHKQLLALQQRISDPTGKN